MLKAIAGIRRERNIFFTKMSIFTDRTRFARPQQLLALTVGKNPKKLDR